ncbi:MAG: AMP-binding protein [Nitrospina sp.]|jgi:fatty-acyl-CoA synthase|nr:AMP-binding protein [Nitrospina sp.]
MDAFDEYTVASVIDYFAEKTPDKTVFMCEGNEITYDGLKDRCLRLAEGMKRLGVAKGDKVAIWAPNSIEWILVQLTAAYLGAVLVPINTRHRSTELDYTLKQSDATIFFLAKEFGANFLDIFTGVCPEIEESVPGNLSSKKFPLLKNVVSLGGWTHPGMLRYEDLEPDHPSTVPPESGPDDVVLIQYTSGTTGPPKGAMLSQGQTVQNAHRVAGRMELVDDDIILCSVPFGHVGGTVMSTLMTMVAGASMIIQPHFQEDEAMEYIEKYKVTVFNGLETFFITIFNHPRFDEFDLSSLRRGWSSGKAETFHKIINKMGIKKICNLFGMSETSPNTSISLPSDSPEIRATTNGIPHEGLEVKISDVDTGETMTVDGIGEICVRGWAVMQGYYKMPEETARAIDLEGWLHTGDLGAFNKDGYLLFKGRFKDLIRVGGENVSPWEVETLIQTHPAVNEVSIVGIKDDRLVEVCAAGVQLKPGVSCSAEEIIEFCRGKLASFKIPKQVKIVEAFPMTESGKVQKFKLQELF